MKFKILNSKRTVSKNIEKFRIQWDIPVTRGKNNQFGKRQFEIKKILEKYWKYHIVYEEAPVAAKIGERGKTIDFLNLTLNIALEVSGEQHNSYNEWMHRGCRENFLKQIQRDEYKREWSELNGFLFVEIFPEDIVDYEFLREQDLIL